MLYHSKSSTMTFMKCPFAFYLSKILHVSVEVPYVMERGKKIHKICEQTLNKNISYDKNNIHQKRIMKLLFLIERESGIKNINVEDLLIKGRFKGYIDFWAEINNSDIILLDYKTGKIHPVEEYKYELYFYAMLYNLKYNKYPKILGVYFIDHELLETFEFDENEFNITLNSIHNITKKIDKAVKTQRFPKNRDGCKWCFFKDKCKKL